MLRTYRTHASNNRGYNFFFIVSHVGFSLMFGGIPLKSRGYKTRAVIATERLLLACVRYILTFRAMLKVYSLNNSFLTKYLKIIQVVEVIVVCELT